MRILPPFRASTVYIHPSSAWQISSWHYFKGTAEPPARWRDLAFDASAWPSGKAPFGYGLRGHVRYGTPLADMKAGYTSVFLRKYFQVDDLAQTTALKLSVNYSDGFVAWLNGVPVAARNAPVNPVTTSVATAGHAASDEHRYDVFPVSAAPLRLGRNVLALQLMTATRDNPSTHLDASLVDTRNLAFNRPASASAIQRHARFLQPAAAVDGTQLTFWSSPEDDPKAMPVWFAVDLGARQPIDRVRMFWWGGELPGLGGGPRDYELQVSDDAQAWRTVAARKGENGGEDEIAFTPTPARHVRIFVTAANAAKGSIGLLDFEVYTPGVPFDAREFDSLALNKPATASSQPSPGSPARKAVDNNATSWWVSQAGAPDPQWLAVDLEAVHRVAAAKIYFSERFALRFAVQLATREGEWRDIEATVDTEEIASGDIHRIHRVNFSQVQEARHARLLLWGTNPHAKAYGDRYTPMEFMVIAAPSASNPPHR